MSSESSPLIPKEKNVIFETLSEISRDIANEQINFDKISDLKKEIVIRWYMDKLVKENFKMLNY